MQWKVTIVVSVVMLAFSLGVHAEETVSDTTPVVTDAIVTTEPNLQESDSVVEENTAAAPTEQEIVADLDTPDARVLPGNPLYIFKQFARAVNVGLTFDPIKRSEKQLDYANTKLHEARQLAGIRDDARANEAVERTVQSFGRDMERIAERADAMKEKRGDAGDRVDAFLDRFADAHITQHKVLSQVEESVPEEIRIKIETARDEATKEFGKVLERADTKRAHVAERMQRAFAGQRDTALADMRHLEIMKNMDATLPPEFVAEMQGVRSEMQARAQELIEKKRDVFRQYIEETHGDNVNRLQVLDNLKQELDFSEGALAELDVQREKISRQFAERVTRVKSAEIKQQMLDRLSDGNPENIKALKQIEQIASPELQADLQQADLKAADRFTERFQNNPNAMKSADTFRRCRANPDAACMEVLATLEQSLTEEQRSFIHDMQRETQERFSQRFAEDGEKFLQQFVDPNPQSLEKLKTLRDTLPPEAQQGIERAIEVHSERLERHLDRIDDPAIFERYKSLIEDQENIRGETEARASDIFEKLREREQEVMNEFRARGEEERRQLFESFEERGDVPPETREIFERGMKEGSVRERELRDLPPESRIEMKRFIEEHGARSPLPVRPPDAQPSEPSSEQPPATDAIAPIVSEEIKREIEREVREERPDVSRPSIENRPIPDENRMRTERREETKEIQAVPPVNIERIERRVEDRREEIGDRVRERAVEKSIEERFNGEAERPRSDAIRSFVPDSTPSPTNERREFGAPSPGPQGGTPAFDGGGPGVPGGFPGGPRP